MKFSSAVAALFVGVLQEVYACAPTHPVTCYVGKHCDEEQGTIGGDNVQLQDCFTGSGRRRLQGGLPDCFGGGNGPVGGLGASCSCADSQGDLKCASFVSAEDSTLTLEVRAFGTDDPLSTKVLTLSCNVWSGMMGEPHIKTWSGDWYDWQGECDAVLLHAPDFKGGLGLDIHTRTRIQYDYSYIETAAIKIGDEILEISGHGEYFLNGVNHASLPSKISDHVVTHEEVDTQEHRYNVELGHGVSLAIKSHKDFVSVGIDIESSKLSESEFLQWFTNSTGLMGSFETGAMLARDGVTVLSDPNEMGQEWQVRESEPQLFQHIREPQYPQMCRLPSASASPKRRLGESIPREKVEEACSMYKDEEAKERCIVDIMATGDLGLASVQAF